MNLACGRCTRIIVVPDIPLPDGYTQKCPACGHDNPVDDRPPAKRPTPPRPSGSQQRGQSSSTSANRTRQRQASSPRRDPDPYENAMDQLFANAPKQPPQPSSPSPAPTPTPPHQAPTQAAPAPANNSAADKLRKEFQGELERMRQDLQNQFEGRLRMLEDRLATQALNPQVMMGHQSEGDSQKAYQSQIHEHLLQNHVLVATQTASVIKSCEATLQRQGFQLQPVTALEQALEQISNKSFQIVIIDQRILKYASDSQALLNRIKQISLPVRRCQLFVMITPNITTGESQVFYQWGIDLNVHPSDLEKLDQVIQDINALKESILEDYLAHLYAYY